MDTKRLTKEGYKQHPDAPQLYWKGLRPQLHRIHELDAEGAVPGVCTVSAEVRDGIHIDSPYLCASRARENFRLEITAPVSGRVTLSDHTMRYRGGSMHILISQEITAGGVTIKNDCRTLPNKVDKIIRVNSAFGKLVVIELCGEADIYDFTFDISGPGTGDYSITENHRVEVSDEDHLRRYEIWEK